MAIRKVYSTSKKAKPGWKYDAKKEQWWSWGYDIWIEDETAQSGKKRLRDNGFPTSGDAEAAAARRRLEEKERKYGFEKKKPVKMPLFRELVEKKLVTLQRKHTRATARTVLKRFSGLLPENITVPEITTDLLWKYINERLENGGVVPATVRREINAIASALNSAPQFFPELAAWQPPRIPRPKLSNHRRERVISNEEIEFLLNWFYRERADDEPKKDYTYRRRIGQMFEFALMTAMREGEICKLRWRDIDMSAGRITVREENTKTGRTRYYSPLPSRLVEILEERRKTSTSEFVFTKSGKLPTDFHGIMRRACRAGNILYGKETPGGLVFHDTRHTATSRMIQAGIDISTVQSITGHGDQTMVLYYSHPSADSRSKAVSVLENLVSGTKFGQNFSRGTAAKTVNTEKQEDIAA